MRNREKNDCPDLLLIEAYASKQKLSNEDQSLLLKHLELCNRCSDIATELQRYYEIFNDEIRKPAHNSLFKLVDKIEQGRVIVAGVLLHPEEPLNSHVTLGYHSEIVLTNENLQPVDLDDLDCIPVDEDDILIRAIQSISTLETTLYLYSHKEKLYHNVTLEMESGQKVYSSDQVGKIEVGSFDLNSLDNQYILVTPKR
ncbi:MAG: hypothetical protein ACOY90_10255 [Candidatus Zhuqueibacterota bacterium]